MWVKKSKHGKCSHCTSSVFLICKTFLQFTSENYSKIKNLIENHDKDIYDKKELLTALDLIMTLAKCDTLNEMNYTIY